MQAMIGKPDGLEIPCLFMGEWIGSQLCRPPIPVAGDIFYGASSC
jgi:hypothetical protein